MTKIIEFSHCGETIRSVAILNFEESKCSVMLMPYSHKDELGTVLVITGENHYWVSEAPIVHEYRVTYMNILNELDLLVIQHQYLNTVSPELIFN
jgi:hypothetical protein